MSKVNELHSLEAIQYTFVVCIGLDAFRLFFALSQ